MLNSPSVSQFTPRHSVLISVLISSRISNHVFSIVPFVLHVSPGVEKRVLDKIHNERETIS